MNEKKLELEVADGKPVIKGVGSLPEPTHTVSASDPVEAPSHYTWIPGIECKDISKHFSSMVGQAIQYEYRHLHKGEPVQDLKKAVQCLLIEIERLEGNK